VARAKRTARAEARRRYRAEQGLPDETAIEEEAAATTSAARSTGTPQPQRLGMGTAFKQAFRPLDLRGDLQALPRIARHSKALWLPILLTIVTGVLYAVVRPADRPLEDPIAILSTILFQYFLQTPAIGGVFIAGFLAPRASWLLGLIVGFVSALVNALLVTFVPLAIFSTAPDPAQAQEFIISGFLLSPVFGALFASGAAWYRRFLQLSNPNRGRRAEVKKGNDGKSRTAGKDQKAGARR